MITKELYVALKEQEAKAQGIDGDDYTLSSAAREIIEDTRLSWQDKANGIIRLIDFEEGVEIIDGREEALHNQADPLIVHRSRIAFDVTINYSARKWELYTSGEWSNVIDEIALQMNAKLETALEDGAESWSALYRSCDNVMAEFRRYGASDTEPRCHLISLLRELGMPKDLV